MYRTIFTSILVVAAGFAAGCVSSGRVETGSIEEELFQNPWAASGPGTVTLVADGTAASPEMTYALSGGAVFSFQTWTFSTVAASSGTIELDYDWSGFHAFFQVRTRLRTFVTHGGVTTFETVLAEGPVNCCTSPSAGFSYTGRVALDVAAGDTYGFEIGGQNFDADSRLLGTLLILEVDGDGDGVVDADDNCPATSNPAQEDLDGDGAGDVCDDDDDGDGTADGSDNCPFIANGDQADGDGDGAGDACDADDDADGIEDVVDACPGTEAGAPVLASGCSVAQHCPCDGGWRNHGRYVRCVADAANQLLADGTITGEHHGAIVSSAAQSTCGR